MSEWLRCTSGEDLTSSCSGPLRIVGSARCVWDDLQRAPFPDAPVMALNWSGIFLPRVDHWASLHREICAPIMTARAAFTKQHNTRPHTHAWKKHGPGVDNVWFGDVAPDFSGCFAVMLALTLGYSPIILCGVPMDRTGHFYDALDGEHKNLSPTNNSWYAVAHAHAHEIFSMSGWTRQLFEAERKGDVAP